MAKRDLFLQQYGIEDCPYVFDTWEQVMEHDKLCDVIILTTQDYMHYQPVIQAMELGYDILLEKPMAQSVEECYKISQKAIELKRNVVVCHVLRYTPIFSKVKELLDSKVIGEIVSVQHNENIGFFHFAHGFVRGPYANEKQSNPMIVAKCCHDMDLIRWLVGKKCIRLSSFGSLTLFKEQNAPEGATMRCTDGCLAEHSCPFSAFGYLIEGRKGENREIFARNVKKGTYMETVENLKTHHLGRCVYHCNNDVVDHQVLNFEFEDGITVDFSVSAFTKIGSRKIKFMGTKGELRASTEDNQIEIFDYYTGGKTTYDIHFDDGGHSGGDGGIMKYLYDKLNGTAKCDLSDIDESYQGHLLAFAAEEARKTHAVIELDEFEKKFFQ